MALFCLVVICVGVLARLFYLQVYLGERYRALSQGYLDYERQQQKTALRGEIFFSGGQPLAVNKDFFNCYAVPPHIKNEEETARRIAEILQVKEESLIEAFGRKSSFYSLLKEKITKEEITALGVAALPGIYIEKKKKRYYPQGETAAQLAGFVDNSGVGRYGVEEYYDEKLSLGESIFLTIDYNIQYQAERMIKNAVEELGAASGEAIVADPGSGAILAMAKTPLFDPNEYKTQARENSRLFKNDSCQTLFEPGSVFKAITMAAAINEGKVNPETEYYDSGMVRIGGWPIYNYARRSYGRQNMKNVLEYSINTGAVFAQSRLGNTPFVEYMEKFGIFEPTGVDLAETFSSNAEFKKGYAINYATASYGQGIWMTSIQLIKAYSVLANGGWMITPYVVQSKDRQSERKQIISEETSRIIAEMLRSVVSDGFGKAAAIPGYSVAGKTGTAQMSWSTLGVNQRGYSEKTTQSFIGFFPASDPKFLILVKLVGPEAKTAEYSAVPVFKDLAKYVIYASQLPPDEDLPKLMPPVIEKTEN